MSFSHNCLHIWLPLWFLLLLVSKMERIKAQKQKLQQKSNSETYKEKKFTTSFHVHLRELYRLRLFIL